MYRGPTTLYLYVLCNISIYVIACANFITVVVHMSCDSLFRCKSHGVLWEDNGTLVMNLVQEIRGNITLGCCLCF